MKRSVVLLWIIFNCPGYPAYFSSIFCPDQPSDNFLGNDEFGLSPVTCTMIIPCEHSYVTYENDQEDHTCTMRFKVTMVPNFPSESTKDFPCQHFDDPLAPSLYPVLGNCSLFYKCNWGSAILFECPSELHFNAELQICDWPWNAKCDFSWDGCPRPYPICPSNYPEPLYLPHPHRCDKFYQCDWGNSHLQSCPTGLHFNPVLKVCDWPYRANCRVC